MDKKNVGKVVTSGLFWTFGERICAQLVSTLVTIVLARMLDPTHYGIISIVVVAITFCDVFVSSGFGKAVVQKENALEIDYNTAFLFSEAIGIILYAGLFFFSPGIAAFFHEPLLKPILRVMGVRIPIAALNNIQQAYIQKHLQFRKFFFSTLIGTVISGVVGIVLAYKGFGVWALVAQYLTNTVIDTVFLRIVCGWRICIQYSKDSAKSILSFGGRLLMGDLVDTTEKEVRTLLIGKVFGSADLAYYDQGLKFPRLFVGNLTTAISKVMLPTFSEYQTEEEKLKSILRNSIHMGTFFIAPLMFGLIGCADNFILVLYTEKWIPCVPFIYIFSLSYLTRPLETFCRQAILSKGRSDVILTISIIINTVSIALVLVSVFIIRSVVWIALGVLVSSVISFSCYAFATAKLAGYRIKEQLYDILPSFLASLVMACVVRAVGMLPIADVLCLILQLLVGIITYTVLTALFKVQGNAYLRSLIKRSIGRLGR